MGFKTIRTSDLSGKVLKDEEVVHLVVRTAPGLDEAKQFDRSKDELAKLISLADLVNLDVRYANGTTDEIACTAEEFAKVVPEKTLADLPGIRGRRPGQRVWNGD